MDRLKLGLIFGASAEEHPVSVTSAQQALIQAFRSPQLSLAIRHRATL
jgi:hypothetical protein